LIFGTKTAILVSLLLVAVRLAAASQDLLAAVSLGDAERVAALLAAGADAEERDAATGYTALHVAALSPADNAADLAALLVDAGAPLDSADDAGRTPLHAAARVGSVAVTRWLIANGADTKRVDHDGRTALELAIDHNYDPVLEVFRSFRLTSHVASDAGVDSEPV